MQDVNRRKFLKASSASLVGASLMGTSARWAGANDRIRVAVLGLGGRGRGHIREASAIHIAVASDASLKLRLLNRAG